VAVMIPSLCYEAAFPLVGIEAFATSTPVIARRIGALTQVAEIGGGWVFSNGEELREVLAVALDDTEGRAEHARKARRLYEERFSEEVHLTRYLSLVDEIERGRAPEVRP